MTTVEESAVEWRDARKAFIALPPNHKTSRIALNRLAEAEDKLRAAVDKANP